MENARFFEENCKKRSKKKRLNKNYYNFARIFMNFDFSYLSFVAGGI